MDGLKQTGSFLAGHIGLQKYDPLLYRYKWYRDSVISTNILRKAAQLVAQIENAPAAGIHRSPVLGNARGSTVNTQS